MEGAGEVLLWTLLSGSKSGAKGLLEKREGELARDPFWEPLLEAGAEVDMYPLTEARAEAPLAEPATEAEPDLLLLLKDMFYLSNLRSWVGMKLNRINASATSSEQMNSTSYKLH